MGQEGVETLFRRQALSRRQQTLVDFPISPSLQELGFYAAILTSSRAGARVACLQNRRDREQQRESE